MQFLAHRSSGSSIISSGRHHHSTRALQVPEVKLRANDDIDWSCSDGNYAPVATTACAKCGHSSFPANHNGCKVPTANGLSPTAQVTPPTFSPLHRAAAWPAVAKCQEEEEEESPRDVASLRLPPPAVRAVYANGFPTTATATPTTAYSFRDGYTFSTGDGADTRQRPLQLRLPIKQLQMLKPLPPPTQLPRYAAGQNSATTQILGAAAKPAATTATAASAAATGTAAAVAAAGANAPTVKADATQAPGGKTKRAAGGSASDHLAAELAARKRQKLNADADADANAQANAQANAHAAAPQPPAAVAAAAGAGAAAETNSTSAAPPADLVVHELLLLLEDRPPHRRYQLRRQQQQQMQQHQGQLVIAQRHYPSCTSSSIFPFSSSSSSAAASPSFRLCFLLRFERRSLERLLSYLGPIGLTLLEEACASAYSRCGGAGALEAAVLSGGGRLGEALEAAWEATAHHFFIFPGQYYYRHK